MVIFPFRFFKRIYAQVHNGVTCSLYEEKVLLESAHLQLPSYYYVIVFNTIYSLGWWSMLTVQGPCGAFSVIISSSEIAPLSWSTKMFNSVRKTCIHTNLVGLFFTLPIVGKISFALCFLLSRLYLINLPWQDSQTSNFQMMPGDSCKIYEWLIPLASNMFFKCTKK